MILSLILALALSVTDLNPDARSLIIQAKRSYLDYSTNKEAGKTLVLAVVTDIHGDGENLERFMDFCEENKDLIDDKIQLGDIVEWTFDASDFFFFSDVEGTETLMGAIGNHDSATEKGEFNWCGAGSKACHERYFAPFCENWGVVMPEGMNYYYKDYPVEKIRLIVLDSQFYTAEQLEWFKGVLEDARVKGLNVVAAQHLPVGKVEPYGNFNSLDYESFAGNYSGSPEPYLVEVDKFIDAGGFFFTWLSGDAHFDFMGYLKDHPRQFSMTFENGGCFDGWNDSARVRGDRSQDSFNIVIFDSRDRMMKVIRVGNVTDRYLRDKRTVVVR